MVEVVDGAVLVVDVAIVVVVGITVVVVLRGAVVVVTTGLSSSSSPDFFIVTIAGLLGALSTSPAIAVNQHRWGTVGAKSTVNVALSSFSRRTCELVKVKLISIRALTPSASREQSMRYESADDLSSHVATTPSVARRAEKSLG